MYLEGAVRWYKDRIGNPLFIINRLKQQKNLENIMNDERFKKFLRREEV